jgi:hypothetical protein
VRCGGVCDAYKYRFFGNQQKEDTNGPKETIFKLDEYAERPSWVVIDVLTKKLGERPLIIFIHL